MKGAKEHRGEENLAMVVKVVDQVRGRSAEIFADRRENAGNEIFIKGQPEKARDSKKENQKNEWTAVAPSRGPLLLLWSCSLVLGIS